MNIQYYLTSNPDYLFDSVEKLKQSWICDGRNPKWVEKNIVTLDLHSEEYILRNIPKQFHAALRYNAYERGHAYGDDEIRYHLQDLADMLEEPIKEYTEYLNERAD